MKKFLISILFTLSCVLSLFGASCNDDPTMYSVTLNANGGVFNDNQTTIVMEVEEGSALSNPPIPTREGYQFEYWTLNDEQYDVSTAVSADLTLYASYSQSPDSCFLSFESEQYEEDGVPFDGFLFQSETDTSSPLKIDESVTFEIFHNPFYTGEPIVQANGKTLDPKETKDGKNGKSVYVYSLTVEENTLVKATGGRKQTVNNLTGDGSFDNPYIVSTPADLKFMAEKVNSGDQNYVLGYYCLVSDIDFMGFEMDVIGDGSPINGDENNPAFFGGRFNGQDSEGVYHTISNFNINSFDKNYVGLFGQVYAYPGMESAGLIYGVRLENVTVTAGVNQMSDSEQKTLSVGTLIGYSLGANVYLCSVDNSYIDVFADASYFSYAGGLIGYQQSFYSDGDYISSVLYSNTDVEINASGMVLYAGGISGYLATNYALDPAFIMNSYAHGNVSGAVRAGGIAGGIGQHCSVSNSYALGNVNAYSASTMSDNPSFAEYCYASAGAIVGFAENDSSVGHSVGVGEVDAYARLGEAYAIIGDVVGNGYEAYRMGPDARKYVVVNSYAVNHNADGTNGLVDIKNEEFLKTNLGWKEIDWVFATDETPYPVINYEPSATTESVTLTIKSLGLTQEDKTLELADYYFTFADLYSEGHLSDYDFQNGYGSYGYFFDEECTQRIPFGYVVGRTTTVYIAYHSLADVAGEYYVMHKSAKNATKLTLQADGKFVYNHNGYLSEGYYCYDGESLVLLGISLGKLYEGDFTRDGEAITDVYGTELTDLDRFTENNFKAIKNSDGNYLLYDDLFFTADEPLTLLKHYGLNDTYFDANATYSFYADFTGVKAQGNAKTNFSYTLTDGVLSLVYEGGGTDVGSYDEATNSITLDNKLSPFDIYQGFWETAFAFGKTYFFDGKGALGTWTDGKGSSGQYNINEEGHLVLGSLTAVMKNGVLHFSNGQCYYKKSSFVGDWKNPFDNSILALNGLLLNEDGSLMGEAILSHYDEKGNVEDELTFTYVAETLGNPFLLTLYEKGAMTGTLKYDERTKQLTLTSYDSLTSSYVDTIYYLADKFTGEWITNAPDFELFDFNGLGKYDLTQGAFPVNGTVSITDSDGNEQTVPYELNRSGEYEGSFVFDGNTYSFRYDEEIQMVFVFDGDSEIDLQRKDILSEYNFVDLNGNVYRFDGKGYLASGGTLTINDEPYSYRLSLESTTAYIQTIDGESYGTISIAITDLTRTFKIKLVGGDEIALYTNSLFTGEWAVSGAYGMLVIGPMDLKGEMSGSYLDTPLTFKYYNSEYVTYEDPVSRLPRYIFSIKDDNGKYALAICSDAILMEGNYTLCTEKSPLYGEWKSEEYTKNQLGRKLICYDTYTFDGISTELRLNGGKIVNGTVKKQSYYRLEKDTAFSLDPSGTTTYYYQTENGKYVMWNESIGNFALDFDALEPTYTNEAGLGFSLTKVDNFFNIQAKDDNGVVYTFDGGNVDTDSGANLGTATTNNGKSYTYNYLSSTAPNVYVFTFTDVETNVVYTATLDCTKSEYTLTLTQNG